MWSPKHHPPATGQNKPPYYITTVQKIITDICSSLRATLCLTACTWNAMPTFFPYWYAISCTSGSEFTRMETLNERVQTVNEKNIKSAENEAFLHLSAIYVKTERTYCFTTVCNKTRCLLEGLLEVVFESLVLVLFGTQLHEFTCNHKAICKCILPASSSACWFSAHRDLPRTRSSMTWDKTFTTVMLPIRAKAIEAAERIKSPAKIAWKRGGRMIYERVVRKNISDQTILSPLPFFHPTLH